MARALLIALLVMLTLPAGAAAHASLVGGEPEPGGVAPVAPRAVTIRFDEAVDPALAVVRVEDERGRRWDTGAVSGVSGRAVSVALRRGAPDGRFVVLYRVVSDDGHTIPGGFGYAVGRDATPPPARIVAGAGPALRSPAGLGTAAAAARALRDGGLAIAAGALLFAVLVWPAALAEAAGADPRWRRAGAAFARALRRLVIAAAAAGAVASVALVLLAAAPSGISEATVGAVLRTHFGLATAIGAGLLAAIVVGTALAGRSRRAPAPVLRVAELGATGLAVRPAAPRRVVGAFGLALALALVPVLGGHATTRAEPALLVASGTTHVLAASAWIGGIAALLVALAAATRALEPADRTVLLGAALRRFSTVAALAVGALALTGVVQAVVEVGSVDALADAAFGRAVLIKAGLLLVVLGIAAAHRLEHLPGLAARAADGRSPGAVGHGVRRTLRVEALGLVAILAATGALAGSPPPGGAPPGPQDVTLAFEQASARGRLSPARPGTNTLSFTLARRGGVGAPAFTDLRGFAVVATGPGGRTVRVAAPSRRDGAYRLALDLPKAGTWRLALTLRVDAFNAFTRTAVVDVR